MSEVLSRSGSSLCDEKPNAGMHCVKLVQQGSLEKRNERSTLKKRSGLVLATKRNHKKVAKVKIKIGSEADRRRSFREAHFREPETGTTYSIVPQSDKTLFHSNVGVEHCSTLPQLMVSGVGCPNSRKSAFSLPALSFDFVATSHMPFADP